MPGTATCLPLPEQAAHTLADQDPMPGAPLQDVAATRKGSGRGAFDRKELVLSIAAADGKGKPGAPLGTVTLNLAEYAAPGGPVQRSFAVAPAPGGALAAAGAPKLLLTIRWAAGARRDWFACDAP